MITLFPPPPPPPPKKKMGWITHHRNKTEQFFCKFCQVFTYFDMFYYSGHQSNILQTSDLDITFQDSNVFRVTLKTGKETSFKHTSDSWSWITKSHDEMPSVKCRPFCRSKTRALIDLWYQKCRNHIANSAVNWTTWSITDTEFSAPSHKGPKLPILFPKHWGRSNVSLVKQHVFTETNTKRMVDPHY